MGVRPYLSEVCTWSLTMAPMPCMCAVYYLHIMMMRLWRACLLSVTASNDELAPSLGHRLPSEGRAGGSNCSKMSLHNCLNKNIITINAPESLIILKVANKVVPTLFCPRISVSPCRITSSLRQLLGSLKLDAWFFMEQKFSAVDTLHKLQCFNDIWLESATAFADGDTSR